MIRPTVGRNVHFHPRGNDPLARDHTMKPLVALLCGVVDDRTVNLAVFGSDGSGPYARQNVYLDQADDFPSPEAVSRGKESFAAWMDYQKGQAAKTDALEGKLLEQRREELGGKLDDKLKELAAQSKPQLGDSDKGPALEQVGTNNPAPPATQDPAPTEPATEQAADGAPPQTDG